MIGGLFAGAMAGGAEAAQDNARTRIKKMHDEAMVRLKEQANIRAEERQWNRDDQVFEKKTQRDDEVWDRETSHKVERYNAELDDKWELERYKQGQKNHRASLPGGSGSRGYAPGGLEKDVEYFKSQGYSQDEAEQRVLTLRGRSDNPITGLETTVESIDAMLGDHNLLANMSDEDIEDLRADRQAAWSRLQELRQRAYSYGDGAQEDAGGQQGGGQRRSGPGIISGNQNTPPQEGDMVGNPDPSDGADAPAPPPSRERGQRPGPSPNDRAEDILSQFGL